MKNLFSFRLTIIMIGLIFGSSISSAQQPYPAAIPVNYDVSGTGGFSYSLPLRMPPGIRDMVPNLAITYNSQGGNGNLGMGWSVAGLSSISRRPSSVFHEQSLSPVHFDADDRYSLDGQKLFETATNSGIFLTEMKNFASITVPSYTGNSPDLFLVEYPNGVIYEYGNSSSSRWEGTSTTESFVWALNKVYDRCGNYMVFDYENDPVNGKYHINTIEYGLNSGVSGGTAFLISFNYEARPDYNKFFMGGSFIADDERLESIVIAKPSSIEFNRYNFTYDQSSYEDYFSRLIKIEEIRDGGSTVLPPIEITWGHEDVASWPAAHEVVQTSIPTSVPDFYMAGDYNGDGATDIIQGDGSGTQFDVYKNDKNDDFDYSQTLYHPDAGALPPGSKLRAFTATRMMFDYDGDGYDDLLIKNIHLAGTNGAYIIHYYKSDGTNFSYQGEIFKFVVHDNNSNWMENFIKGVIQTTGDFDGDGKTDLIVMVPVSHNNSPWVTTEFDCLIVGDNYYSGTQITGSPDRVVIGHFGSLVQIQHQIDDVVPLDYNGDGKTELLITGSYGCQLWEAQVDYDPVSGSPGVYAAHATSMVAKGQHSALMGGDRIFPGDFNGDGNDDVLFWRRSTTGGDWDIAYSKALDWPGSNDFWYWNSATHSTTNYLNSVGPDHEYVAAYHIADFNGDGKDDILEINDISACGSCGPLSTWEYNMHYSMGEGRFDHETGISLPDSFWSNVGGSIHTIGDFNGDGQMDLMCGGPFFTHPKVVYFYKNDKRRLVTSVEHAGKRIGVTYASLAQDPDYTVLSAGLSGIQYPFVTRQLPLRVVKELEDNFSLHNTYKYSTLVYHTQGLGMRGFWDFKVTDATGKCNLTHMNLINFRTPVLIRVTKYVGNSEGLDVSLNYSCMEYSGGANGMSVILKNIFTEIRDQGHWYGNWKSSAAASTGTGSVFYDFGQPDSEHDYLCPWFHDHTEYTYDATAPFYNKAKPKTITKSDSYGTLDRSTEYEYNTQGLVYKMKTDAGTGNEKTTTYTYNAFGNVTMEQLTASSMPTVTNEYHYSDDGRFLVWSKNPLNYVDSFTYDTWGNMINQTSYDGLVTSYQYDKVNRLIETTLPTGVVISTDYDWAVNSPENPTLLNAQFSVTTQTSGISGRDISFYDYYGRNVREVSNAFDGQIVYSDVKYKDNGLVDYTTTPYYKTSSGTAVTTTFTYDDVDREIQRTTSNGGATITTEYDLFGPGSSWSDVWSLTTTVTNTSTGEVNVTQADQGGRIVKNTNDAHGGASYSYNPDLTIASITHGANVTNYTYDAYQRVTKKAEPNVGDIDYTYDKYDRVLTMTDALSNVTTYTYDLLGRVTQKVDPSGTYTYTYDNTPGVGSTGKLLEETAPNGSKFNYYYDGFGRLTTLQETIISASGTKLLTTNYTYDVHGRKETHTYPNSDIIHYSYNSYGHLEQVSLDPSISGPPPQLLWKINSKNHLGEVTQSEYYNNTNAPIYTFTKTYDDFGRPQYREFVNNISSNAPSNFLYSFDAVTGNLSSRQDLNPSPPLTEWFTYDLGDKLTDVTSTSSVPNLNIRYSDHGNILGKTDVSTSSHDWLYNAYALQTVPEPALSSPIPYLIPANTQDVEYWPFKKVKSIREVVNEVTFSYGPDLERNVVEYNDLSIPPPMNNIKTRYYASNYENTVDAATGDQEELCYVWGGNELIAIIKHTSSGSTLPTATVYYTVTDYLGSITHIMDNDGIMNDGLIEERSFDAWGRPRDPATWQYPNPMTAPGWMFDRGYTGHEHIWVNGLYDNSVINMNGRLYDPLVARMFSPDPVMADETRDYNKYTYARNNPLKYTDPSGEIVQLGAIAVGAIIGGVANTIMHWNQITAGGGFNWALAGAAFGIGATAGALAGATGGASLAASGTATTALGSAAAAAVAGGVAAASAQPVQMIGNSIVFGDRMPTAGEQAFNIGVAMATAGIITGVDARLNGMPWRVSTVTAPTNRVYYSTSPKQSVAAEQNPITLDEVQITANRTSVYQGVDNNGNVKYVGITDREPSIRFGEHLNSVGTGKENLNYRVVPGASNLSRIEGRIMEQNLINQNGLDNLLNVRNSIAPKYWQQYGIIR